MVGGRRLKPDTWSPKSKPQIVLGTESRKRRSEKIRTLKSYRVDREGHEHRLSIQEKWRQSCGGNDPMESLMNFFNVPNFIPDTCVIPGSDYPQGMFFLTRRESMVIILVMTALATGAGIRHWRMSAALPAEVR